MTIFVYTPLSTENKAYLQSLLAAGMTVVFANEISEENQRAVFQQADILVGTPPAFWFQSPVQLRWWQLDSVGFDSYKSLRFLFPITNVGDYFAWPCAETIVAGIQALYRGIHTLSVLQSCQQWVGVPLRSTLSSLRQKKVVILGAGTIGQAVQKILTGYDCESRFLAKTNPLATLRSTTDLLGVLPQTDVVVNCLPGTATGFFSADLLAAMKLGSIYANIGRGSTTDETALIAALQEGRLGGAVLDVTEVEPLPITSPLWTLPNVILTQHTGGGLQTEDAGKVQLFIQNLNLFLADKPLNNQVNLERGY